MQRSIISLSNVIYELQAGFLSLRAQRVLILLPDHEVGHQSTPVTTRRLPFLNYYGRAIWLFVSGTILTSNRARKAFVTFSRVFRVYPV